MTSKPSIECHTKVIPFWTFCQGSQIFSRSHTGITTTIANVAFDCQTYKMQVIGSFKIFQFRYLFSIEFIFQYLLGAIKLKMVTYNNVVLSDIILTMMFLLTKRWGFIEFLLLGVFKYYVRMFDNFWTTHHLFAEKRIIASQSLLLISAILL